MAPMKKPGLKKALQFVWKYMADTSSEQEHLPPIQTLATGAEVSFVTMWKAIAELKGTGVVQTVRGGRIRICSVKHDDTAALGPGPAPAPILPSRAWTRVAVRIERDVHNGRYAPGQLLPAVKELKSRYGVASPTVRRALVSLEARGLVARIGRGYRVSLPQHAPAQSTLVLLVNIVPPARRLPTPLTIDLIHYFEQEAACAHLSLWIVGYYVERDELVLTDFMTGERCQLAERSGVVACACFIPGTGADGNAVLAALSRFDKPIAILDETGSLVHPLLRRTRPPVALFGIGITAEPGRRIARLLLGLGHRRVAYISLLHRMAWSQRRLEGLKEVFFPAAGDDAVTPFVSDLAAEDLVESGRRELMSFLQRQRSAGLTHDDNSSHIIDKSIASSGLAAAVEGVMRRLAVPLFEEALRRKEITAWVMSNDRTAVLALEYLAGRNIPVPQRLSVVSFDNRREAIEQRLSSYDFNLPTIVRQMVASVMGMKTAIPRRGYGPVEIEGTVIQRESTDRPRLGPVGPAGARMPEIGPLVIT